MESAEPQPPNRDNLKTVIRISGVIATSVFLSSNAFTRKVRNEIVNRDGGRCVEDGQHMGGLEAAHYDHDRSNPDYNNADNGRALCTQHHLESHIDNEGNNGLPPSQNQWAIRKIKERLDSFISRNS